MPPLLPDTTELELISIDLCYGTESRVGKVVSELRAARAEIERLKRDNEILQLEACKVSLEGDDGVASPVEQEEYLAACRRLVDLYAAKESTT